MLGDVLHHGAARAALQKRVEAGELFGGADGVDFHTAVAKIANKTGQSEVFGFVLGKVAEADTLHDSGNKIAACDLVGGHQSRDCSKGEAVPKLWQAAECDKLKRLTGLQLPGGEGERKRILVKMEAYGFYRAMNAVAKTLLMVGLVLGCGAVARTQDTSGPLTPPPTEDHNVHRVTTTDAAAAPPGLPPAEIVKAFAEKEDRYLRARVGYGYKKTIKLTEFGKDGQPSGEYQIVTQTTVDSDGRVYEKTVEKPQSSLHYMEILPGGGVAPLTKLPAYPLVTSQLAKYDLRYVGDEKVDEIDCYIFNAKPKLLERANALFQGVVWVDKQYLEVVKTYGKWVNDLGDVHPQEFPFVNFETYRENVDGKYWFPSYSRSDDFLHFKDESVPVRLIIKWTDIKPLPASVGPLAVPEAAAKPKP